MRAIYLVFALALLVLSLLAVVQNRDVSTYRVWSGVDRASVTARGVGENRTWELRVSGSHEDACALALHSEIARYPHNIDVQLYREIPSTAACDGEEAYYEKRLTLAGELIDGRPPYLLINSQAWGIDYGQGDEDSVGLMGELALEPVHVEQAGITVDEGEGARNILRIRGSQAVGCALPEVYSLRESTANVVIGAYNAIALDSVCPTVLVDVEDIVMLPATDGLPHALTKVNAIPIEALEMPEMSAIDKVLTNIQSVKVKTQGNNSVRVTLDVTGEHPDGCDYPVIVSQAREDRTVTVEVFREVPADVFCPMILRPYEGLIALDGEFAPGSYVITVNAHSQSLEIEG